MLLWSQGLNLYPQVGGRVSVDGFVLAHDLMELSISFEGEEQFARDAEMLAQRASRELLGWRDRFPTFTSLADHLDHLAESPPWDRDAAGTYFDAGIAAGLTGRREAADHWLRRAVEGDPAEQPWLTELRTEVDDLRGLLADAGAFRSTIVSRINGTRGDLGLATIDGALVPDAA